MPFIPILIGVAVAAGLGVLSRVLMPKPKVPTAQPATRDLTVNEPDAPWQIVYGERVVGGSLFAIEMSGANNEFLYLGIVWCYGGPDGIESIDAILFGDEVAVNGTTPIAKYSGLITVEHHLGTDAQTASTLLTGLAGGRFSSSDVGAGHAYTVLKLKWDENAFQDFSIDKVRAHLKGRKVLDTRTGLVAYSTNPVVCLRDYLSNTRFGLGYGQGSRPLANIMDDAYNQAQADVCDVLVNRKAGGTRVRYALNLAFSTENEPGKIVQAILATMAGGLSYGGGLWRIQAGAWAASVLTLTDDDLRGPVEMQIGMGRLETFNAVRGEFMDPTTWQPTNYPAYGPAGYLTEDGGIRIWHDMNLDGVTDAGQAQQLAKIALEQARRPIRLKLPCKFLAYQVTAGDRIAFTHDNWTAKTFFVERLEAGGQEGSNGGLVLGVDLFCREDDSTAWDWTPATDEGDYTAPAAANAPNGTTVPPPVTVSGDLAIENGNFEASGTILPPPGYIYYSTQPSLGYETVSQYSGSRSIQITTAPGGGGGIVPIRKVMCRPGDVLYVSARAKCNAGSMARVAISFRSADGTGIGGGEGQTTSTGWVLVESTQTAPAGTVYATFELYASPGNETVWFDEHYVRFVRNLDTEVGDGSYAIRDFQRPSQAVSVPNSDFEASATVLPPPGWQLAGSPTLSYETGTPYAGTRSLKMATTVQDQGVQLIQKWACRPGDQFFVSGACKSDGTGLPLIGIYFLDAAGSQVGQAYVNPGTSTSWSYGSIIATAPANAVTAVLACFNDAATQPSAVWVDQISVQKVLNLDDHILDGLSRVAVSPNQRTGAGRAFNVIDAAEIVVASGIDFSRGYTGKHLGNMPDDAGTGRRAIVRGSSTALNEQSSISPVALQAGLLSYSLASGASKGGIKFAWSARTAYRADGTTANIPASSTLALAAAPTLSAVAGGSLGARSVRVAIGLIRNKMIYGIGATADLALGANQLTKVTSPGAVTGYDGWIPIAIQSTATSYGWPQIDPAAAIAFGTDWTEPAGGIAAQGEANSFYLFNTAAVWAARLSLTTAYWFYPGYNANFPSAGYIDFFGGANAAADPSVGYKLNADGILPVSGAGISITTSASGGSGSGSGGGHDPGGCFTGNCEIRTPAGLKRFDMLPRGEVFLIQNRSGVRAAMLVAHDHFAGEMIELEEGKLVTPGHHFLCGAGWMPAEELFRGQARRRCAGCVYNLHVLSEDDDDHHYILWNGAVAHNVLK